MPESANSLVHLLAIVTGYILGSIPFGLLITKLAGLGDIRSVGSGNIGATNVLRTGRKDLALATLILDSGKAGFTALAFTHFFGPFIGLLAGAMALIGHCYPVWLGFKGGKGVATYAGLLFATSWQIGLIGALSWFSMAFLFKRSSLAALVTGAIVPLAAWALGLPVPLVLILAVLTIIVFWQHRANIVRLLDGTEPKIGASKKAES